ncbi:MAG: glycosyltransferase family 4 protein [Acidobacteria bacterium]|nr:glycosyltransferase family 4 protein [Acidobacteriota bacterium]
MRLGVNVVRLTRQYTGVGRYIECLLLEWSRTAVPFREVVLFAPAPIDPKRTVFPLDRFQVEITGPKAPDPVWEWTLRQKAREVDVLFCPSYTIPVGYPGKCVVTYLGPAENVFGTKEWCRNLVYEQLYRYSVRKASHVLACSHAVKRRLTDVYGIPGERVSVTFLAASHFFRPVLDESVLAAVREQYLGCQAPYLLFVGKLAGRHHIPNLLRAFAMLRVHHKVPHKLLLVGPDYLKLNVPKLARDLGIGESVIHVPFIDHKDLPPVYSAAEVFVYPVSEAEGFGIPVVEAMACGTPVISSKLGSLPEVAAGAALLTETSATEELYGALNRMMCDGELCRDLRSKGLLRASQITWPVTAAKTMEVLWRVAGA